jgi:hypothetical protein
MKRANYRAATIALAVAALSLTILASMLSPLWRVHRAGPDAHSHNAAHAAAPPRQPHP